MTLHRETLAAEALKKVEPAADKRRPVDRKPAKAKPVGPMIYSVSKGSDVFWPARQARKA
jgi:expansin (peptidoglycan-binding protein)